MSNKTQSLLVILLLGVASFGFAQSSDNHAINFTIPNIMVIDVDNNGGTSGAFTTVGIVLSDPTSPGAQPAVAYSNNDNFLNYTSVVATGGTHKISAKLNATLPGVNIRLTATAPTTGFGSRGTSAATNMVLTTSDQTVISAIGSCWTNTGGTDGAALVYDITFDDANFSSLLTANPVHTVTFTISD
jgi:hypothetical protein